MGCGASSGAVPSPRIRSIASADADSGAASPRGVGSHGLGLFEVSPQALPPPSLRVTTIGPLRARAAWQMVGHESENNPAPDRVGARDPTSFLLQMDADLADGWPGDNGFGASEGFVDVYRGADLQYDIEVEPGCSMRFRVAALLDGGRCTAWSNEVGFVTQASVPRRPDAPCASAYSHDGIQVMWTAGQSGGLPIEQYDVQMSYGDAISIPRGGEICLQGSDDKEDPSSLRLVYSGSQLSCFVAMSVVGQVHQGLVADISAVRFRVQARNAMGYSEWSPWSETPGGSPGENPERLDGGLGEEHESAPAQHESAHAQERPCSPHCAESTGGKAIAESSGRRSASPRSPNQRSPFFGAGRSPAARASPDMPRAAGSPLRASPSTSPSSTAPKELIRAMANVSVNAPALKFQRPQGVDQLLVSWEAFRASADGVAPIAHSPSHASHAAHSSSSAFPAHSAAAQQPAHSAAAQPSPKLAGTPPPGSGKLLRRCALAPYALRPTPYTLRPTPYALHATPAPYALHATPAPYALRPTPYALHPTPYTLHATPYALRPTPYALHATRYTLNPRYLLLGAPLMVLAA